MEGSPDGIQIIEDITTRDGVDTLEGRIGPLLLGEKCQCHFIEMKPGMFCGEHPHPTESLIYTVKGRWVLCSQGKRFHMKPGALFWFGPDIPTGYEVPFDEDVFLLIFKGERSTEKPSDFTDYLLTLRDRLIAQNRDGIPFAFAQLPEDHPAKQFAAGLRESS